MKSSSNLRQGSVWIDKLFETINQEFTAQGRKISRVVEFWNLLQGAQSQEFSRMRAQFRLCQLDIIYLFIFGEQNFNLSIDRPFLLI